MSVYLQQITTAIRATTFRSASEVFWFGKLANPLPRRFARVLTPGETRACQLTGLQDQLYTGFYCTGAALPSFDGQNLVASGARSALFVDRLSQANCGSGYLEPGWSLRRVDGTMLVVCRNGFELRVHPRDCQLPTDTDLSAGLMVGVRLPKGLSGRQPGFYLAMGDTPLANREWNNVVRLYWNVTPSSAIDLMHLATTQLNAAHVPFQLKVHGNLARVARNDGAVLYLHKQDYEDARGVLERVHAQLAPSLRAAVPALTKRLAPGLGLAENPGNDLSFGEHRCRLLAEALIRANELGKTSVGDCLQVVQELLENEGIRPDMPYMNPGSEDAYLFNEVGPTLDKAVTDLTPASPALYSSSERAQYVDAALLIGRQICQYARWSDNRCNWMGATTDRAGRTAYGALGPHLYGGTSGVALFLAELHAATGDAAARSTALGAIEHALRKANDVPDSDRIGLFTGWIGIALAAARIGILLDEEDLLARAQVLLRRIEVDGDAVDRLDHISGAAGAIAGLLALNRLLMDQSLIDTAVCLGDTILDRAIKTRAYWSWNTTNMPREASLTGLSHGAAGIACGLLELFRASGDARYLRAAESGFAYERYWFAAAARNWPDLQGYPRSVRRSDMLPCGSVWCHGAPGIALSRLRAYEITGDIRSKAEALIGLQTTCAFTESALQAGTMNFSLCHGLAGNAEVLLLGETILETEFPSGSRVAGEIADLGLERYARTGNPWPCGATGPTPGLMDGLAGMGYFYLRLTNPATPSILLLNPERFVKSALDSSSSAAWDTAAVPV